MNAETDTKQSIKRLFGWIGLISLLLIIPLKVTRFVDQATASTPLFDIAPSFLGPAGLFFLILSSSGKLSRLSPAQVALLVAVIAVGLELAQLLPQPWILARVYYTFDWLDVFASVFSVCVSYLLALFVTKKGLI